MNADMKADAAEEMRLSAPVKVGPAGEGRVTFWPDCSTLGSLERCPLVALLDFGVVKDIWTQAGNGNTQILSIGVFLRVVHHYA